MAKPEEMYQCQTVNCGYVYDPDRGDRRGKIPKGTAFKDLPDDWRCPVCGATKKMFKPLAGQGSAIEESMLQTPQKEEMMAKYVCQVCGYVYDPAQGDPDNGVPAGTAFEKLPDSWECPVCGAGKADFAKE
jgi:rubredoxin